MRERERAAAAAAASNGAPASASASGTGCARCGEASRRMDDLRGQLLARDMELQVGRPAMNE